MTNAQQTRKSRKAPSAHGWIRTSLFTRTVDKFVRSMLVAATAYSCAAAADHRGAVIEALTRAVVQIGSSVMPLQLGKDQLAVSVFVRETPTPELVYMILMSGTAADAERRWTAQRVEAQMAVCISEQGKRAAAIGAVLVQEYVVAAGKRVGRVEANPFTCAKYWSRAEP